MSKQAAGIVAVGGCVVFLALAGTGHVPTSGPVAKEEPAVIAAIAATSTATSPSTATNENRQAKLKDLKQRAQQLMRNVDALEHNLMLYTASRASVNSA